MSDDVIGYRQPEEEVPNLDLPSGDMTEIIEDGIRQSQELPSMPDQTAESFAQKIAQHFHRLSQEIGHAYGQNTGQVGVIADWHEVPQKEREFLTAVMVNMGPILSELMGIKMLADTIMQHCPTLLKEGSAIDNACFMILKYVPETKLDSTFEEKKDGSDTKGKQTD